MQTTGDNYTEELQNEGNKVIDKNDYDYPHTQSGRAKKASSIIPL